MRRRGLKRQHLIIVLVALFIVTVLFGVNSLWPSAFGAVVAIAGTAGALLVIYEVRLTKQIAQAEFVRELQNGFTADPNISELWRKLLLGEEITEADRPLISNYLTFFETLYLLQRRNVVEFDLIDELFRNRFFSAIGNPQILSVILRQSIHSFANIHALIADWHHYMLKHDKPVHEGYYAYVKEKVHAQGFEVELLGLDALPEMMALQDTVSAGLTHKEWLRSNTEETFVECLTQSGQGVNLAPGAKLEHGHIVLGGRSKGKLVSAAVLFAGRDTKENIKRYLSDDPAEWEKSINLKLVLTDPDHRGSGIGRALVELLEAEARVRGYRYVLCTIHPKNVPSRTMFDWLGYHERRKNVPTAYGKRSVYERPLNSISAKSLRATRRQISRKPTQ